MTDPKPHPWRHTSPGYQAGPTWRETVPVIGRNLTTNTLREFSSVTEAASFLKVTPAAVSNVLRGKSRQTRNWHFTRKGKTPEEPQP